MFSVSMRISISSDKISSISILLPDIMVYANKAAWKDYLTTI